MSTRRGGIPQPIKHGTRAGYNQHYRRKKRDPSHRICRECQDAWNEYQTEYRAKRRERGDIPAKRITIPVSLFVAMYWAITDKGVERAIDDALGRERVDALVQAADKEGASAA